MRIWEFDRLGGMASEQFDINKDGLQFVSTVLGFLWMDEEELGFDPTIITANGERFIEIKRNGSTKPERIIIDGVMQRTRVGGVKSGRTSQFVWWFYEICHGLDQIRKVE